MVERRFCAGAGALRGGARQSGMEAALGWIGFQGGRPGVFKGGRAGIAAGHRGIRIPATSPVISGPLRSREGRGEEGADARGRLVSGGAVAMRACWALAAPTGGAGGSGGSRARSGPVCGAGVLGWQRKRAWAAEALGRSGSGDWAAGSERAVAGKGEGGVGRCWAASWVWV